MTKDIAQKDLVHASMQDVLVFKVTSTTVGVPPPRLLLHMLQKNKKKIKNHPQPSHQETTKKYTKMNP